MSLDARTTMKTSMHHKGEKNGFQDNITTTFTVSIFSYPVPLPQVTLLFVAIEL